MPKYVVLDNKEQVMLPFIQQIKQEKPDVEVLADGSIDKLLMQLRQIEPFVVFINPRLFDGAQGMAFIGRLKDKLPATHVVIVTNTPDYSVDAFEYGVTDYLLFPVQQGRLQQTIARVDSQFKRKRMEKKVYCFGDLDFATDMAASDKKITWRTKKARELFAYLLHKRDEYTRKDFLVDLLWPDLSWKQGITLLYSNMYQVRKFLQDVSLDIEIKNLENYYVLHLKDVGYDVDEWEQTIDTLPPINQETSHLYMETIYQYRGDFLDELNYHWAEFEQQRLRIKWLWVIDKVSKFYTETKSYYHLKRVYHYMIKINPALEEGYFYLMKLYAKQGKNIQVDNTYELLQTMTAEEYAAPPQEYIKNWYDSWRQNN